MIIINKRITDAINTVRSFEKDGQLYWIDKLDLCNSEKGFIMMYLEHYK